jgi:hypothetical protein
MEKPQRLGVLERSKQEEFRQEISDSIYNIIVGNPSSIDFREINGQIHVFKDDKDTRRIISKSKALYFMRDREQDDIVNSHFSCKD